MRHCHENAFNRIWQKTTFGCILFCLQDVIIGLSTAQKRLGDCPGIEMSVSANKLKRSFFRFASLWDAAKTARLFLIPAGP